MNSKEWTYDDTSNWGHDCSLSNQSPINIDTGKADTCKDLCELEINYQPSICSKDGETCSTIVRFDKHQNLKISYNRGSNIIYKNNPYNLSEITFHTPSLHQIDGMQYDLEICLIHSKDDNPYTNNGVFKILLDSNFQISSPFTSIFNMMPDLRARIKELFK